MGGGIAASGRAAGTRREKVATGDYWEIFNSVEAPGKEVVPEGLEDGQLGVSTALVGMDGNLDGVAVIIRIRLGLGAESWSQS